MPREQTGTRSFRYCEGSRLRILGQGAIFAWALFFHSDLWRADVRDANLMGANMTGATGASAGRLALLA